MSARLDDDRLLPRSAREWGAFLRDGWREGLFLALVAAYAAAWLRILA